MSDEILYTHGLHFSKGSVNFVRDYGVRKSDVAGDNAVSGSLDLTTAWELIPLADVATPGVCSFENIGSDTIEIREDDTGDPRLEIAPGEAWSFRVSATGFATPAARAANTVSRLSYLIVEA